MTHYRIGVAVLAALSISGFCIPVSAFAAPAAPTDCAPTGHLPDYVPVNGPATIHDYGRHAFTVSTKDGGSTTVGVSGRFCKQEYVIKEGSEPLSDTEIQYNYRDQLRRQGGELLYTDDRNTTAKLVKNGQETWVEVYSQENDIFVVVVNKQPPKLVLTAPAAGDHPLLGHMPNYLASPAKVRNFDTATFTVQQGDGGTSEVDVQGRKTVIDYTVAPGKQASGDYDIQANYQLAVAKLGGQTLFADDRNTTARFEHQGQPIWVGVYSQENDITVTVIEEKAFQASIEPPPADTLKSALDQEGHVALYLNFDFAKATLKPDAAPVIAQVVKLMKEQPALRLEVEGHTDNIGDPAANLKLSQERATTVVAALVNGGIAANRLSAKGVGAERPIADNASSEGRAKNRRVELHKRG